MKRASFASAFAAALCAGPALAQAPLYIDLFPGSTATDVAIVGNEIVVVGNSGGGVFRWVYGLGDTSLGATSSGGNIRLSADGTRVATTTTGTDGITRAALWTGGTTWTQLPGLAGSSGTSQTTAYGISGDGLTVVGLGWSITGTGHCYRWNMATGASDLGGPFSDPASRANGVNGDGTVIVGWKDLLNGTRQGARWVNGVMNHLSWVNGATTHALGEALRTNTSGSTIVGMRIFGGPNSAWRWDAGTGLATPLPNLAGETTSAAATDLSDDGTLIVGHSGGNVITGTRAILWINDVPQSLHAYLTSLGTVGIAGYPDLGLVTAISDDGNVIVGQGTGFGSGQPGGGWVVIFPDALQIGTAFCSGDGTATACPCGNNGAPGHGCASSVHAGGALLKATGVASISADSVTLRGSSMPNAPALYFQGTTQQNGGAGAMFGDGLRCAGGTVVRLGTKVNVGGESQYPSGADLPVATRGLVTMPGVRTYQVWYRNAAAFCTAATFNLSNGLQLTWAM